MAFSPPVLGLVKKGLQKGGHGHPGPPLATPLLSYQLPFEAQGSVPVPFLVLVIHAYVTCRCGPYFIISCYFDIVRFLIFCGVCLTSHL